MMTSESEVETLEAKVASGTAVLEVSTMAAGGITKQESRETDLFSNYSTSAEGSVVASPSTDSFSTLPEHDSSDLQFDSRDLQIKVDNPQKHLETLETFVTFRVTTKTSRPEFSEREYIVRRRYNDFNWLRQKLVDSYPTHIIPPIPGKHTLLAQLDRYSKEFIASRMKLLHIFMNRIANHPILSCDQNVHIFLCAKPAEFAVHRKNHGNVFVKVTDSLQNIVGVYTPKRRHVEFERVRDYCISLREKLLTIDKISNRMYKERQDYLCVLHQLHPIFTLWATSEPELSPVLLAIARAIEANATANQKLLDSTTSEGRDYIAYVDAVKDALARRDSMQAEYEMTVEELAKYRIEKDQLLGISNGSTMSQSWSGSLWKGESRDEKLERLGHTVPRLSKRVEMLQDRVECANENLRSDLERWNIERRRDLKQMLASMADRQIVHYQQCMRAWEEVLAGLKLDDVASNGNENTTVKIPP
ncbi:sorting nexin-30-like [Orussus abietinus]|uniref:sorting nexin-30-like n=1 Tax=Orussus abietinus TaxID=222816 RepID=UPI000626039C|nr:sorting nexin-30-like [Orussus abietinus]